MLLSLPDSAHSFLRQTIRQHYRIDEAQAMASILPRAEIPLTQRTRAWERARKMVLHIRQAQQGHGGVDALLNEFSLSTAEGIALMCLAEALLRIPDTKTQDDLIRDKLAKGEWAPHLGNSDSLFVNASAWGLLFTGNLVEYADEQRTAEFGVLKKTLGRLGEPVIRKSMNIAMKVMGKQFVMGETINEAVKRARTKESAGYAYSYDMLGEGARTQHDADRYYQNYVDAIHVIGKAAEGKGPIKSPGISVKLSAIHPRYEWTHYDRVMSELPQRLKSLCLLAKQYDIGLTVDAEESERLDISLDIIGEVYSDHELGPWCGFGLAVQAYQTRAIHVIDYLCELSQSVGRKLMVRLVKGAYWDSEIKHSQQLGVAHYPVFTRKSSTDVSYHACANKLLAHRDTIFPQFATHNAYTASVIIEASGGCKDDFEFQCLHGMGDSLYDQVVTEEKIQCRVYAPVGQHEDLLAYLVRRLLENGANSSFVNAIVDPDLPVESLLIDPVERTTRLAQIANTQIPLPTEMFQDRKNSKGLDIFDQQIIEPLVEKINQFVSTHLPLDLSQKPYQLDDRLVIYNPARPNDVVAVLPKDNQDSMLDKLTRAQQAQLEWSSISVHARAKYINQLADALEIHQAALIGLCMQEAGKVLQDSIDEIREAVDFCRYYAVEAQKLAKDPRLSPRGVVLCISPWNFPLAIFLGQVVAALVTGNTVLAKPAEQTSLIAHYTRELMTQVGIPLDVCQLIFSDGIPVGECLLPDDRINAVMFTGSTQTGTRISQTLAQRKHEQVPLIAETGGQNCMIVDSTALPEQVVDDVITSGFQSAGQRCSALRVLYVQEEIADKVITMISGAMRELNIGLPSNLATDIGPVIDAKALRSLEQHAHYMSDLIGQGHAQCHYQCEIDAELEGYFWAPRLYEIDSISRLEGEVFGPCVHVIRFKGDEIDAVVEQINATGFGLTMGIHSRLEFRAEALSRASRAGNVYINRNMIGAVVGVQPFGGRGLSGTGPKAGGPNYLPRLLCEKATPKVGAAVSHHDELLQSTQNSQDEVNAMLTASEAQFSAWRGLSVMQRTSVLRQMLAQLDDVPMLLDFADDLERTLGVCRQQLMDIEKHLKTPRVLPGPTGERNVLQYEPRGVLVCLADKEVSFEYWALSLVTALGTGNMVISVVSDEFYAPAQAFAQKLAKTGRSSDIFQIARLHHVQALLTDARLAGVIIDSQSMRSGVISSMLAAREGAILPVITAEYNDTLLQRTVTEKTISIDTTASGGNTSLMTLVDSDD